MFVICWCVNHAKIFVTFGGGGSHYEEAADRISKQISELCLFDNIVAFKAHNLQEDTDFWNKHGDFIINNKRGYYLIRKTMKKMKNGDILFYSDCGNEFDDSNKLNLEKMFNVVCRDFILGVPTQIEKVWCKKDLANYFSLSDEKMSTPQFQSGQILLNVNDTTRKLINEWYDLACDYHNIDDSPSEAENLHCFQEHRHDQSVLSLLIKKYDLESKNHLRACVHILRNKNGKSRLKNQGCFFSCTIFFKKT